MRRPPVPLWKILHVALCVCVRESMCVCVCLCVFVCLCVGVCVCLLCVCCVCLCVFLCVHTYMCVHTFYLSFCASSLFRARARFLSLSLSLSLSLAGSLTLSEYERTHIFPHACKQMWSWRQLHCPLPWTKTKNPSVLSSYLGELVH